MAFSASDAAFEGFRLTRRSPMTLLWWALAFAVFLGVFFALTWASIGSLMVAAEALEGNTSPTPEELGPFISAYSVILGLGMPLGLLFGAVINAAVSRAVLRPDEKAFGYLRVGADELRVLLVTFVLSMLAALVFGIGFMIIAGLGGYAATADAPAMMIGALVAGVALFGLLIWLAVRFSLAVPIVVAERRIAIFDSWGATRGRFWPLFGMAIIAFVMAMIVNILASVVLFGAMAVFGLTGGLADLATLEPAELLTTMAPFAITYLIVNAILSAMQTAVLYAPFSAAYRAIKAD